MIDSYTFENWLTKKMVNHKFGQFTLITGPNNSGKSSILKNILISSKNPNYYLLNCKNSLGSLYIFSPYNMDEVLERPLINSLTHQGKIFGLYSILFPEEKLIKTQHGIKFVDAFGNRYKTYELSFAKKQILQLLDFLNSKNSPSLVMIDDYGCFLDPETQIALLNVLKKEFKHHQFILTSHSTELSKQFDYQDRVMICQKKIRSF